MNAQFMTVAFHGTFFLTEDDDSEPTQTILPATILTVTILSVTILWSL